MRIREPGLWVDTVQFGGFDERGDDCPAVSAIVETCEKGVLTVEGQRLDAALGDVGIRFDSSVGEEVAEPVPVAQCVANSLGEAVRCP